MNNKGFAITSIIYGLMLLFIVIISSFLSILVGRNRRVDELVDGVYETVEYETINVTQADFENEHRAYITEKRGLYNFDINGEVCLTYLPKSVILITGADKSPGEDAVANKLYYKINDGDSSVDTYEELEYNCIN